ncbi:MAG: alpha/beta hydrolase [Micrococcus sp.]|nr:alpha/beta hydrolase [Micrococcus sp.]
MLHWTEFGDPRGIPALYFHGTPSSRLEARALDTAARDAGVRVISLDRPGMGRSPHIAGRTLVQWPGQLEQCLDCWGLERVGVIGFSGGGPYAVACLARIPERLTAVALLAPAGLHTGIPFWNRVLPHLYLRAHAPLAAVVGRVRRTRRVPGWMTEGTTAPLVSAWREAFAQGPAGPIQDEAVINEDWSGLLREAAQHVTGEGGAAAGGPSDGPWSGGVPVRVWQGAQDRVVSIRHGRFLAGALGAQLTELAGVGHRKTVATAGAAAVQWLRSPR